MERRGFLFADPESGTIAPDDELAIIDIVDLVFSQAALSPAADKSHYPLLHPGFISSLTSGISHLSLIAAASLAALLILLISTSPG